jgi:hypothetical protein
VNLYCGMGLMVGILIPFFKHGPFAWNGVLGFWVVATDFFIWVFVMYFTTLKAVNADVATAEAVVPALVAAR